MGEKSPSPHQIWCTASALQCLRGADVSHNICTVPILALLVQAALFLSLSICGLGQWTPQVPLLRPSYGERKETKTLKMVFPHLTQYTVLFYSEPFSAFSPNSGSVKRSQPFFLGPLIKRLSPHLGWSIWPSNGKTEHGELAFFAGSSFGFAIVVKCLKAYLLYCWLVALIDKSNICWTYTHKFSLSLTELLAVLKLHPS